MAADAIACWGRGGGRLHGSSHISSLISVLGCTVGANGPYDIHAMDASFWGTLPLGLPLAYLKPP